MSIEEREEEREFDADYYYQMEFEKYIEDSRRAKEAQSVEFVKGGVAGSGEKAAEAYLGALTVAE